MAHPDPSIDVPVTVCTLQDKESVAAPAIGKQLS